MPYVDRKLTVGGQVDRAPAQVDLGTAQVDVGLQGSAAVRRPFRHRPWAVLDLVAGPAFGGAGLEAGQQGSRATIERNSGRDRARWQGDLSTVDEPAVVEELSRVLVAPRPPLVVPGQEVRREREPFAYRLRPEAIVEAPGRRARGGRR